MHTRQWSPDLIGIDINSNNEEELTHAQTSDRLRGTTSSMCCFSS